MVNATEIVAVYSEDHIKFINTLCKNPELLIINKAGGKYRPSYQWTLND
jgi:hypothetical protein